MKQEKKLLFLWIFLLIIILGLGAYFGGVKIQIGTSAPISYSPKELTTTFQNLQNITGKMVISPGSLPYFLSFLGQAKYTIKIETYEFTEKKIKEQLEHVLKNNTNIKLIMENQKYQQFQNTFKQIQNYFSGYSNFHIQSDAGIKTKYVHSKITLVDSGFIIQTANLTHSSFFSNREYFFQSTDSGIYTSLATIFQKDWEGKPIDKSDIHPNLVVCPINCRAVVEHLIGSAKKSIYIQNQYIDDEHIKQLLQEKIGGLGRNNIHIQLPATADNKLFQQSFGKDIVYLFSKPYLHAKMLLIDEHILLLSSINLSANSMDNNREIGILLLHPDSISQFLNQFSSDLKNK